MGCLKSFFAMIGLVTVVAIASVVAWHYRADLKDMYREWASDSLTTNDVAVESVGHPGEDALHSARRQNASMESDDGPAMVMLNADEMASLVVQGIARSSADAFDSLTVTLGVDRITLDASVVTEVFARELLGQFASILDRREHISVSGPVRVSGPGVMVWEPDELRMRAFPFPGAVVGAMINAIAGGSDGAFLIQVPTTVGDVRVRPDGVTFYRRAD